VISISFGSYPARREENQLYSATRNSTGCSYKSLQLWKLEFLEVGNPKVLLARWAAAPAIDKVQAVAKLGAAVLALGIALLGLNQ